MGPDSARDLGGRRFPAHLDTHRPDERGCLYETRRDRPERRFGYDRDRTSRDALRRREGVPEDHHVPVPSDSPWERAEGRRRAHLQREAEERQRRFLAGEFRHLPAGFECTCPPECEELDDRSGRPVHAADCPCSCDVG